VEVFSVDMLFDEEECGCVDAGYKVENQTLYASAQPGIAKCQVSQAR
jgi:hypothetical protein